MLRFDINLSMTLADVPFLERFQRAVDLGFGAVEFFWPDGIDLDDVVEAKEAAGVEVALFNMNAGDAGRGDRGLLSHPEHKEWWRGAFLEAVTLAERLGCKRIHAVAGNRLPQIERSAQIDCAVENLTAMLPHLERAGVIASVESLNVYDTPDFLLTKLAHMMEIVQRIASPHVRCQFDIYHMQRMEGNLIHTIRNLDMSLVSHVQIADSPARHHPGTGEIHFRNVLAALDETSYDGYVGLEYRVPGSLEEALAWLPRDARRSGSPSVLRV
jgi:hydroxypyruvate isomerase